MQEGVLQGPDAACLVVVTLAASRSSLTSRCEFQKVKRRARVCTAAGIVKEGTGWWVTMWAVHLTPEACNYHLGRGGGA